MTTQHIEIQIRPLELDEYDRFRQRIAETSWHDLSAAQRARLTLADITPGIHHIIELLMGQGSNIILVADTPAVANLGQVWLGEARDPYTGSQRGYIYDLYVEPAWRGHGVGRALLEAAEAASRARGDAELGLTVADHNQGAKRLYHALGFVTERHTLTKPLADPPPR